MKALNWFLVLIIAMFGYLAVTHTYIPPSPTTTEESIGYNDPSVLGAAIAAQFNDLNYQYHAVADVCVPSEAHTFECSTTVQQHGSPTTIHAAYVVSEDGTTFIGKS